MGFILYNILYIRDILINLISYSKLSRTKYPIKFIVDGIKISKNGIIATLASNNILRFNIQKEKLVTILRTNLLVNLVDGLIISSTPVLRKYTRSINYSLDLLISTTSSYSSTILSRSSALLVSNSRTKSKSNPKPRYKKVNNNTIAYYYRVLGYSNNIR